MKTLFNDIGGNLPIITILIMVIYYYLVDRSMDYFYISILMIEFYLYLIHWTAILKKHRRQTPYNDVFVRMILVFETYSLNTCFWLFDYYFKISMTIHYIFHTLNNPWLIIADLPDFSKPAPNKVLDWFEFLWLCFDIPCHTYLIYYLCFNIMSLYSILISIVLFSFIVYFYPWHTIYK